MELEPIFDPPSSILNPQQHNRRGRRPGGRRHREGLLRAASSRTWPGSQPTLASDPAAIRGDGDLKFLWSRIV